MIVVILDVLDFLELVDVQSYLYTHRKIQSELAYFQNRKKIWINSFISPTVQEIFPESLLSHPFIPFQDHFLDEINYLRYIYPKDLKKKNRVLGCDKLGRPFIVLTYQETVVLPVYQLKNIQTKILTLFRHPDGKWSNTSPYDGSLFSKDPYREYLQYDLNTSITYKRLYEMYRGKTVSISKNNLKNNLEYHYSINIKNKC